MTLLILETYVRMEALAEKNMRFQIYGSIRGLLQWPLWPGGTKAGVRSWKLKLWQLGERNGPTSGPTAPSWRGGTCSFSRSMYHIIWIHIGTYVCTLHKFTFKLVFKFRFGMFWIAFISSPEQPWEGPFKERRVLIWMYFPHAPCISTYMTRPWLGQINLVDLAEERWGL